ncbi:uncharacterized protein LOC143211443 isoform X2 [Lasioglossum baleicum]|uniref:uncharacterized protein LOC143211443 isoform X2 n=1 Tax=Lasioglossum baleicum TaxID=434251 RepID=UPI003FCCFEA0
MILIFSFNVHTFQNQQRPKRQPQLPAKYKEDSGKAEPSSKIRKKQPVAKEQQKTPSREDMLLLLQASMESSDPQVNVEFPPNPLIQNRSTTSNNPKPSSAAACNFSTPLSIPIPTPTLQMPPPQQDSITILLHLVQQLGQRIDMGLQQLEQKVDMGLQQLEQKVEMSMKQLEKKVGKITGMLKAEYLGQRPHWLPLESAEDV